MKRLFAVVLSVLLSTHGSVGSAAPYDESLNGAVATLAATLSRQNVSTVAVADFTDLKGEATEVGRFVADEISSRLVERGRFRVVDRAALMRLLRRDGRTIADIDDPAVQDFVAKTLSLSAVVKGTLVMVGGAFRLNLKVVDTASRTTIGAVLSEIPATESLTAMQGPPLSAGDAAQSSNGAAPGAKGAQMAAAVHARPVDVVVGRYGVLRLEVATVANTDCCTTLTLIATPVRPGIGARGLASSAKVALFNPKVAAYLVDARGEQKAFRAVRGLPNAVGHDTTARVRTVSFEGREIPFNVSARFSLEFDSRIDFAQKTDLTFKLLYTDSSPNQIAVVDEVVVVIRAIAFDQ